MAVGPGSRVQAIDLQQRQRQEQSGKIQHQGNLARTKHLFPEAENYFKQALQLWPGNEAAAKNFATMLRQLGRTGEAISVLENAVPYAQEQLPIYNLLTNFCTDAGKFSNARNYGQKALKLCGDATAEIGVLTSLTTLEVKAGNIHQALEYCDAILRINPKHEHFRKERKRLEAVLSGISTDIRFEPTLVLQ
jgi:tetratricopeptide (TPR) repeat protein